MVTSIHDGHNTDDCINVLSADGSRTVEEEHDEGRMWSNSSLPTDAQWVSRRVMRGRKIMVARVPRGPPNS
eukprot:scaffold13358_cov198-Alexandrium_tamarense.AAC.24